MNKSLNANMTSKRIVLRIPSFRPDVDLADVILMSSLRKGDRFALLEVNGDYISLVGNGKIYTAESNGYSNSRGVGEVSVID